MTLTEMAAGMGGLAPSCGRTRLIAVDGHAGAGKTTLARHLAAALGGSPVVHTDDLATHEQPFDWTGRLAAQVLGPLGAGRGAVHEVYDWHARRFAGEQTVDAAPCVVLEGVGTGRAALRPHLALVLWLEVGPAEARRRGLRRDGPELTPFWTGWTAAEDAHFAADPTRPYADLLVHQDQEGGYRFTPGPAARAAQHPNPADRYGR
ncbi:uridine kinase [Streptomyces sp. NPDC087270]|uniref:uridine kinase family protein n=1 Tax=Streptomyces sp. NPDC087270 TaxID=3365774 RepID=UPI00382C3C7A